jgi:PAS domain S-box-containing protein
VDVRQFLERAFPDHSIGEKLREDAESTLFQGRRIEDGQAVLFVTSVAEHPTSEWLVRIEREYALREDLELPWAARLLALLRLEGRMVLLLEDPGGLPLDAFPSRRLSIAESLRLALGVAVCLSWIHAKGVLHGDIKPANILADPRTGSATLMGFGIAAGASPQRVGPRAGGTELYPHAYKAPEQTDCVNPRLDARSDLYALGVVLYEALTGRLPFDPSKPRESQLPQRAVPAVHVNPAIPRLASDLVMKLLAKLPEQRYQTAVGLEADLRRALIAWEAQGRVEPFPLAQEELRDRPRPVKTRFYDEAELVAATSTRKSFSEDAALGAGPGRAGTSRSSLVSALCRLSAEIESGKLVETLMGIAMNHSGAERGLLLLSAGDGFRVEAEAGADQHGLAIWQPRIPLAAGQVADEVLRRVLKAREPLILQDASSHGLFTEDAYVRSKQSKSILGLPLLKQSRLLGVLYFENSLAAGVFTANRVEALEVLAAQAAISLENARLFADLEQEKRRLQAVIQQVPAGLIIAEAPSGRFLIQNDRVERILHHSYRPSSSVEEYEQYAGFRPDGRPYAPEEWPLARSIRTGETVTEEEVELRWPDGSQAWLSLSSTPIRNPAGIISSGILIFQDVTERKRREEALRASEERFSKAFKNNPTPMAVLRSKDATFVDVNEQFLRLLGYTAPEIYGRCAKELGTWFIDLLDEAGKRLQTGGLFRDQELSAAASSGESKALLVSIETMMLGGDTCYLAIFVDLTERKQVEEQLRQSQKMEAIGSLAGGVAHDFNNLLTAINGYSELAMMGMEAGSPEYEHLRAVRTSGERAAGLTRQLLAFSRKEAVQNQVQSLNAIVTETEGMLRRLIEENVEIDTCLGSEVGSVNVDKGQVVQILMNLVVNARDAMPQGGRLLVETRRVRVDGPTRNALLEAPPGVYAMLTVKDTGTGMTPQVKAKIFEPFFTTKAVGKGTGLGLSVVYGVVRQLGGAITLQSEPGQGTTFSIYFPEVNDSRLAPASESAARNGPEAYRGSETILVVEDEDAVRRFIKRALTAQGYRVLESRNGVEALRLLELAEQPLDLVMTDLIMPDMGGRELAVQVRAHRPALPVLYTSGYSEKAGESHEAPANAEYFLPKPFGPTELARKVREVLRHSGQAHGNGMT